MMNPPQVLQVKFRFMTRCHQTFWVQVFYLYFKIIQAECCIHWIWCSDWIFFKQNAVFIEYDALIGCFFKYEYKIRTQMVYVGKSWWDTKVKKRRTRWQTPSNDKSSCSLWPQKTKMGSHFTITLII